MKALVAQELSGPSGLAYTDVDDVGGEDVVVIDVGAAGVCFPDLLLLRGEYQMRLEPPFIPGMEVAGVVRSAPYESAFNPGQRVSAFCMLGGYAERVAVAPENIVPTPDDVDDAQAASLFGSGVARLVEAGLRPPPPVRFPLSKGAEALESLANGGVKGKLVLQP
jgi:NADPH2:quinone reductase